MRIITSSFLLTSLVVWFGRAHDKPWEHICIGNTTDIDPEFEFQPFPEEADRCDTGYCFCLILDGDLENHKCPWQLDDFPGDLFSDTTVAGVSFDPELYPGQRNVTSCLAETPSLLKIDDALAQWTFAPTTLECGYFVYAQRPVEDGNFYVHPDDIRACPTSFADVEVYTGDGDSANNLHPSIAMVLVLSSIAMALPISLF